MMVRPTAIERAIALGAIGLAVAALATHASVAIGGNYLNYVSGIWLAQGRDLQHGVFYRDVIGELGYGGTRYFPLFFTLIGLFMRVGLGALTAGWLTSGVAAAVLAGGMFSLVRSLGGGRLMATVFAVGAVSPYFVQQTLFEIRADVLAAALNVCGLACLLPEWGNRPTRRAAPGLGAVFFTLALATKVSSLAIPGALIVAGFAAGNRKLALGVLWRFVAGVALFFAIAQWASHGRALENWRACMFAGSNAGGTLGFMTGAGFLPLVQYSRLLTALLVIVVASLVAGWFVAKGQHGSSGRRALWIPVGVFLGASLSTAFALSSPGTVASNQMVEWIEMALVVLAFLVCTQPRLTRTLFVIAGGLTMWASTQDLVRARQLWHLRADPAITAARQNLVSRVASASGPVLSESALWPVLAGREVYLLDPFALRVMMQSRKDIEQDLAQRLNRGAFPLVILQVDPTTRAGGGYYENVNFGWTITQKILDRYRLESHPLSDVYVYVPR